MITKHQLDRALGNIRLLGPDIPSFRYDAKLVSDYIKQLERQRDELLEGLDHIGNPRCQPAGHSGTVIRREGGGHVIYDPITTFAIYLVVILGVFTFCAIVADLWLAHDERKRRDQVRAEARAKRVRERKLSSVEWQ